MEKELVIFHSFVTYSFSACARAHIRDQDWVDERHLMADHDPDQNHVGAEVDGKLASEKESVDGQNLKDYPCRHHARVVGHELNDHLCRHHKRVEEKRLEISY